MSISIRVIRLETYRAMNWPLFALLAFASGIMKLGFGMGSGAFFTPLAALISDPVTAVTTMAIILWFTSIHGAIRLRAHVRMDILRQFVPFALVSTVGGTMLLAWMPRPVVAYTLGALAVTFGVTQLLEHFFGLRWRLPAGPAWAAPVALASGLAGALANSSGLLLAMYLQATSVPKLAFVATISAYFLVLDTVKIALYLYLGTVPPERLPGILALLPLALAGGVLGTWLNQRISARRFPQVIAALVLSAGVLLLVK